MSRPDDWMVEVELVEEPGGSADAPGGVQRGGPEGDVAPDPAEPVDARPPARGRGARRPVVVAGVVAVVLGAAGIAAGLLARGAEEPVRYDHPLAERWTLPGGTVLGVADGVVAVLTGTSVAGRAEADGTPRWERSLGVGVDSCAAAVSSDPGTLWCLRDAPDDAPDDGTTVVGLALRDGSLVDRRTEADDVVAVADDVVLARRRGDALALERRDGRTWAVRWSQEVSVLPNPGTGQYGVRLEAVGDVVVVHGPTTVVLDAADGGVLGTWEGSESRVLGLDGADVSVTSAGFAASTVLRHGVRLPEGTWYDRGGRALTDYEGVLAEPAASDGSEPGVLLLARDGQRQLAAVDVATGTDLWTLPMDAGAPVLRHEGTVVVAVSESTLRCLDLVTGRERWSARVDGLHGRAGAVSDGSVVVVLAVQDRDWMLDALDVGTGELVWFARAPGAPRLDELFWAAGAPELGMLGDAAVLRVTGTVTWLR